jgi:hypothetical protein
MPSVTLAQLTTRVYDRLDGNSLLYTQANITDALNECIRVTNANIGWLQATIQVPGLSQPGRVFYDVPAGILVPMRVQFEDAYLQKFFLNSIGKACSTWVTDTTATTGMPVSSWVPMGFSKFAIHPADSQGGSPIIVTGIAEPAPLVNRADIIPIPNEFSDLIVNLSAQVLTLKETGALFKQSSLWYQQYMSLMKKYMLWRTMIMPRYFVPELKQAK